MPHGPHQPPRDDRRGLMLNALDICAGSGIGSAAFEACGMSRHGHLEPRPCKVCGMMFSPRKDAGAGRGLYCGRGCAVADRNPQRRIHHPRRCPICSEMFTPYRHRQRCCSRKCGRAWQEAHKQHDPLVSVRRRLAVTCCSFVARTLRSKTGHVAVLLGYSTDDLMKRLEDTWLPGMGWSNYGRKAGQWSVDHIRPISTFALDTSPAVINALDNLRALWVSDNCSKRLNEWGEKRGC